MSDDFKTRFVDEYNQLCHRVEKLNRYLKSDNINKEYEALLVEQLAAMKKYLSVLICRASLLDLHLFKREHFELFIDNCEFGVIGNECYCALYYNTQLLCIGHGSDKQLAFENSVLVGYNFFNKYPRKLILVNNK